jgi:hypothetical protein
MFHRIDPRRAASQYVAVAFQNHKEAVMAENTGTSKSKIDNLEDKQEERDAERRGAERVQQQDLNQGIDTGTHDSVRHGVNWGSTDSGRTVIIRKRKTNQTPRNQKTETTSNEDRSDE